MRTRATIPARLRAISWRKCSLYRSPNVLKTSPPGIQRPGLVPSLEEVCFLYASPARDLPAARPGPSPPTTAYYKQKQNAPQPRSRLGPPRARAPGREGGIAGRGSVRPNTHDAAAPTEPHSRRPLSLAFLVPSDENHVCRSAPAVPLPSTRPVGQQGPVWPKPN